MMAAALAAAPLLLVDAAGGNIQASGAPGAAAMAPAEDLGPDVAAVLAQAGRDMPSEDLGIVSLVDRTVECESYSGDCEPVVVCDLTDLELTHFADADGINFTIEGETSCLNGRLEFVPIVGGERIPGPPPTIRGVNPGSIEISGELDPAVCGLGSVVRFEVTYVKTGHGNLVGLTNEVPLAICDIE